MNFRSADSVADNVARLAARRGENSRHGLS